MFDEFNPFGNDHREEENLVEEEEDLDVQDNVGLEIISDEIEEGFKSSKL